MPLLVNALVVLAFLLFVVGMINAQWPVGRSINWIAAGLACLTLAWLVSKG